LILKGGGGKGQFIMGENGVKRIDYWREED